MSDFWIAILILGSIFVGLIIINGFGDWYSNRYKPWKEKRRDKK